MLKVLQHPLITHKLTQMRKKETGTKDFRQNLDEIAYHQFPEISRFSQSKSTHLSQRPQPMSLRRKSYWYRFYVQVLVW